MSERHEGILSSVAELLGDLFGVDPSSVQLSTRRDEIAGWDSLQHVNLVIDLESRFGFRFSEDEVMRIDGVQSIVEIIAGRFDAGGRRDL